jgi:pimeloyl-ACP methyl ester carboxylesterase
MTATVKRLERNGFTLEYLDTEKNDGPVLLLLHSIRSAKELFQGVLPLLAESFRVLAVDLRGHGNSTKMGPYSFEQITEDIRLLLDAENIGSVSIAAASFSCVPAQMFAASYPERVEKLVLMDGGFFNLCEVPGFDLEKAVAHHASVRFAAMSEAEEAFGKRYEAYGASPDLVAFELERGEDGRFRYKLPDEAFASYFQAYCTFPKERVFASLSCPVLLLLADEAMLPDEEQRAFFRRAAEEYVAAVKDARMFKIPQSLHLLVLTHPQETVEQIVTFILGKGKASSQK